MKRAVIGGFISLIGSIWALAIAAMAAGNLTGEWSNPPGRFLTTLLETGVMPWFVLALVLLALGLVIMGVEYFKKDR